MKRNREHNVDRFPYEITYWSDIKIPLDAFKVEEKWIDCYFQPTKEEKRKGYVIFTGNETTYFQSTEEDHHKEEMIDGINDEWQIDLKVEECEFTINFNEHQDTP